jgi:hypothetical protein
VNKNNVDDKTLSDYSLLPLNETRVALNELFAAGFIQAHELPSPSKDVIYEVNVFDLAETLAESTYNAIYNLKQRLTYELDLAWD